MHSGFDCDYVGDNATATHNSVIGTCFNRGNFPGYNRPSAAAQLGNELNRGNISRVLSGKARHTGGWFFKRVVEPETRDELTKDLLDLGLSTADERWEEVTTEDGEPLNCYVSNLGRYQDTWGRVRTSRPSAGTTYAVIGITIGGVVKLFSFHRLVLIAFAPCSETGGCPDGCSGGETDLHFCSVSLVRWSFWNFPLNKAVIWTDHIISTQTSNNIWHNGPGSAHGNLRWATFSEQSLNQIASLYHSIKSSYPHEGWLAGEVFTAARVPQESPFASG